MNFSLFKSVLKCVQIKKCLSSHVYRALPSVVRTIHTTNTRYDLMEFFDIKKNWNESEIRLGRSWRADELRIKSNTDLHKLWYVLLKERNMLFTMEHECKLEYKIFPNPERIDKVEESMKNIEIVVRERNEAYYKLETGESGERPEEDIINLLGLPERYKKQEYVMPKHLNTRWVKPYLDYGMKPRYVRQFLRLYREKQFIAERREKNRTRNHIKGLFRRFPDLEISTVEAMFPGIQVKKEFYCKKSRGHFEPKD